MGKPHNFLRGWIAITSYYRWRNRGTKRQVLCLRPSTALKAQRLSWAQVCQTVAPIPHRQKPPMDQKESSTNGPLHTRQGPAVKFSVSFPNRPFNGHFHIHCDRGGFPGGSGVKNLPASAGDTGSIPGSGSFPGEGNGKPIPVFSPGKFHGLRSLMGYSLWGRKESDTTERLNNNDMIEEYFCLVFVSK